MLVTHGQYTVPTALVKPAIVSCMANPEHVAILQQGVSAWNLWRMQQPAEKPDFQGANLETWTSLVWI